MKPSLQLRIGQSLTMTPQLQQAIRLLQLPVIELQTQIQQALESNVMLETNEDDTTETLPIINEAAATPEASSEAAAGVIDEPVVEDHWDVPGASTDAGWKSGDSLQQMEFADTSGGTLQEHLIWQLELEDFDREERVIGLAIIDAINDDGYLVDDLETICRTLAPNKAVAVVEVETVLAKLQRLEPAGVAARSISECLELQLLQLVANTPGLGLALEIVRDNLELLGEHQYSTLRRKLRASEADLEVALALVRSMHPRPGSIIHSGRSEYIVPDVFVRKLDGRWVVEVNSSITPTLRVNQQYARQLTRASDHGVLRGQLQEARWLIRSLEIRNETLFRVATCIVARQQEFLEHGDEAMTPMVLRDVAEALEMHESTISRVTTNKYMRTPRGVFEFRHFFSSHVGGADGAELSSVAIRAMIRRMIAKEDPRKPLSDNKIAQQLVKQGANVARRTVAKYREALSIACSSDRKRLNPK